MKEKMFDTFVENMKVMVEMADEGDSLSWTEGNEMVLLVRNEVTLSWRGYVGVKKEHPCYGNDIFALNAKITRLRVAASEGRLKDYRMYEDICFAGEIEAKHLPYWFFGVYALEETEWIGAGRVQYQKDKEYINNEVRALMRIIVALKEGPI